MKMTMFNFLGGLFHKIGITIGAVFISLGAGLGGQTVTPPAAEPVTVTTEATTSAAALPVQTTGEKEATPMAHTAPPPATVTTANAVPNPPATTPTPTVTSAPKTEPTKTAPKTTTSASTQTSPQSTPAPTPAASPTPTLTAAKGEAYYTKTIIDDTHQRADFTIQAALTAHDGPIYVPRSSLVGGPISDAESSSYLPSSFACSGDGINCVISGSATITMTGSVTGPQGNYHSEFRSLQYGTSPNGPFTTMSLQYKTASLTVLSGN